MSAPQITITNISKTKIGWQAGVNQSIVTFTADQPLVDFEARAGGVGKGTGLLVGESGVLKASENLMVSDSLLLKDFTLPAGQEAQFEVERDELQQDGNYRINVYGCNAVGEWTPYG